MRYFLFNFADTCPFYERLKVNMCNLYFENIISEDTNTGLSLKVITNVEGNRGIFLLDWVKEISYETRTVTLRWWIPDTGWWTSHWEVKDVQADLPSCITRTVHHVLVSPQICIRVSDIWIVDFDVRTIYPYRVCMYVKSVHWNYQHKSILHMHHKLKCNKRNY